MKREKKSIELVVYICELWYSFEVVDIAMSHSVEDEEVERAELLEEHIENKEAFVVANDFLYDRQRKNLRRAIVYRSDINAFDGKLAWQDYRIATLRRGLFGRKPT